ncbi:MAG: hypothetical protein M3Z05_19310 [Gemmatimonadota bacterium]|nr:hypothetical protein [Gemmatimonadota bacterium]
MRYFILDEDMTLARRRVAYPRQATGDKLPLLEFINGTPFTGSAPLQTRVAYPGIEVDVDMILSIPVIRRSVAGLLQSVAVNDIECVDVEIDGVTEPFVAINVLRRLDCVDERRTGVRYATVDDPAPGGLRYRALRNLRVLPSEIGDAQIFRIIDWPIPIIVSEAVRNILLAHEVSGIVFQEV